MTGPRDPTPKEAQLPDDLDQNPCASQLPAGSGDAELLTGASAAEGDVETGAATEQELGRTND